MLDIVDEITAFLTEIYRSLLTRFHFARVLWLVSRASCWLDRPDYVGDALQTMAGSWGWGGDCKVVDSHFGLFTFYILI